MEDTAVLTEDQSHYEISLTAGQAFVAFVLLLLSLAASFAFGLLIGKGQNDGLSALKREPAVINEAVAGPVAKKKVVDVPAEDFKQATAETPIVETQQAAEARHVEAGPSPDVTRPAAAVPAPSGPAYAQLLSSGDQKAAEALAEKLIGAGFSSAFVERMTTDKGTAFRVRVKFGSDADARAAEAKLKTFSKDVWITSK